MRRQARDAARAQRRREAARTEQAAREAEMKELLELQAEKVRAKTELERKKRLAKARADGRRRIKNLQKLQLS